MENNKFNFILSKSYNELIKKEQYEKILLNIINESRYIFHRKYEHIDNSKQSKGESDFRSSDGNELIDAKIIFPSKQCESLSNDKIKDFIDKIIEEVNETFYSIMDNKCIDMNTTILYKEISKAFDKIADKENVLIFIPFPFTMELEYAISSGLGSDIFSQIIRIMKKEKKKFFNNHKIYFIYPNIENKIIIKNISERKVEYLKSDILSKYIKVNFEILK